MINNNNICEGDTFLISNILSFNLSNKCLNLSLIENELNLSNLSHKGKISSRKVCIQGIYKNITSTSSFNTLINENKSENDSENENINDNMSNKYDIPLYRTPGDKLLFVNEFTTIINEIKEELNEYFKQNFNHVKIQLYRDGNDYITKHSDKTLDIERNSSIYNLNLGVQRYFTLQNKETNEIINLNFEHNSIIVIGWKTNIKWTHCVHKQPNITEKRISLVFRSISTWLTPEGLIYGQGGKVKTREEAIERYQHKQHKRQLLLNTLETNEEKENKLKEFNEEDNLYQYEESQRLLHAFSEENRQYNEDYWDRIYGEGFDVFDLSALNIN